MYGRMYGGDMRIGVFGRRGGGFGEQICVFSWIGVLDGRYDVEGLVVLANGG